MNTVNWKGTAIKMLLLATASMLCAPTAFASKARLTALGVTTIGVTFPVVHLVDSQTIFSNPAHMHALPDFATYELGATPTFSGAPVGVNQLSSPASEGGFVKSDGDLKWGVYLGKRDPIVTTVRTVLGMRAQENGLNMFYGKNADMDWGIGFDYSSSDAKSTSQKQSTMMLRWGLTTDAWAANGILGLGSSATGTQATNYTAAAVGGAAAHAGIFGEYSTLINLIGAVVADPDAKYTGTAGHMAQFQLKMDEWRPFVRYSIAGVKYESAANATPNGMEVAQNQLDLGVFNITKLDGGQFFWGVVYQNWTLKESKTSYKKERTNLPVHLGLEYDASSWLTFRGSVRQNVFLSALKEDTGAGAETDTKANDTTTAAGVGLKLGKWLMDGTLAGQSAGTINATTLLASASLTYNF